MKITDCTWELLNLGKITTEITLEPTENIESIPWNQIDAEYLVLKTPDARLDLYQEIHNLGFSYVENQIFVSKRINEIDKENPLIGDIYSNTQFNVVDNENKLNAVVERMTEDMFSTDRISLDPLFGTEIGLKRYRNWLRNEFDRKNPNTVIAEITHKGDKVGFIMIKIEGTTVHGVLGGLYKEFQDTGIGIITSLSSAMLAQQIDCKIRILKTCISSNNLPVIQLYNYLQFKIVKLTPVFVKHIEN